MLPPDPHNRLRNDMSRKWRRAVPTSEPQTPPRMTMNTFQKKGGMKTVTCPNLPTPVDIATTRANSARLRASPARSCPSPSAAIAHIQGQSKGHVLVTLGRCTLFIKMVRRLFVASSNSDVVERRRHRTRPNIAAARTPPGPPHQRAENRRHARAQQPPTGGRARPWPAPQLPVPPRQLRWCAQSR